MVRLAVWFVLGWFLVFAALVALGATAAGAAWWRRGGRGAAWAWAWSRYAEALVSDRGGLVLGARA
ncbi:MAG: hypothetical protein U0324_46290 [Polyangiales bacterium]